MQKKTLLQDLPEGRGCGKERWRIKLPVANVSPGSIATGGAHACVLHFFCREVGISAFSRLIEFSKVRAKVPVHKRHPRVRPRFVK